MSVALAIINGMALPPIYVEFLRGDDSNFRLRKQQEEKNPWYVMFPKEAVDESILYNPRLLTRTNEHWITEKREIFLGKSDHIAEPGMLTPSTSVIIGELAQDNLIALNFANSTAEPSVCYLHWYAPYTMRWTLAAMEITVFLRNLKII